VFMAAEKALALVLRLAIEKCGQLRMPC